jgi:glucose-1-phosphate cytidylyltransferase
MIVVILAGGYGTRLQEETGKIPKPMVTIGGIPILWHIVKNFHDQGFTEFIVAGGFQHEVIRDWTKDHFHELENIDITVTDTGMDTQTGGRVKRLTKSLSRGGFSTAQDAFVSEPFILTYGDGLADINYKMLIDHHVKQRIGVAEAYRPLVTLTAVNPPSRFGRLRVEDGYAKIFVEKGQDPEGWINAGFYVCEPFVLDLIPGDACIWEKDLLPSLALQGRLTAFQHTGEFQMMDTWRDRDYLEKLWKKGAPFWTRWSQE